MNNTRFKNVFLNCFFAAILLLSFFAFSGIVTQTKTTLNRPQTTLVVNSKSELFKSIHYKRALITPHTKAIVVSTLTDVSRLYSQQVKIQITELTNSYIPPQTSLFYKPNTASQNADDDSTLILG